MSSLVTVREQFPACRTNNSKCRRAGISERKPDADFYDDYDKICRFKNLE